MNSNLENIQKLQEQNSSQKKFQAISDDPYAASMSISLKSRLQTIDDITNNANMANDWLNANEFAFQKMEDLASQADTLLNRGVTDTLSDQERYDAILPELEGILSQAIDLANTKYNDQYIFAGYKTNGITDPSDPTQKNPPVVLDEGSAEFDPYTISIYTTDKTETVQRNLEPGKSVTLNFFGDSAFGNFLQSLVDARNALKVDLSDSANQIDVTALRTAWSDLQSSMKEINQYHTENGARMRQVDGSIDFLEKSKTEAQSLLTKNEGIDLAEGISKLTLQQTAYQIVLEVSQRAISTMNLFDYMQ
jgi:flagellar hook-associated protein 3 FlgL